MNKFCAVTGYLNNVRSSSVEFSFSQIEAIIDGPLCMSARKYHSYWHISKTHMLPQAFEAAGFSVVSVSLIDEIVTLVKI